MRALTAEKEKEVLKTLINEKRRKLEGKCLLFHIRFVLACVISQILAGWSKDSKLTFELYNAFPCVANQLSY